MEGLELLCFKLISAAGTARSCNIEAIQEAKKGEFEKAEQLMKEGEGLFLNAHEIHNTILAQGTNGGNTDGSILVMHAEDQLMSAEMFQIIAKEFIDTCRRMSELERKVN
ncbi:PTS lactose/cellobiose transporter subunit IIA [Calorimonas adulescens]|jgi:PTS system, Lactose/Cellobiose specific IIA subunit.|uniref:PTS lactose/cellobiose transporter subunit IIA n=1 Tax=Calorimonas adulescens TaxID=2606906 RepID=A0A5D8QGL2_9THEO|nr:PTS lactose/cellobiose transporter subunit IIA [Calorimonas adulescens]TZE82986.1 PTS lactose/cellobiose transporter subunit IIA [Calorimonas adulescens]